MGTQEYEPIAARYRVPIVVTGFEPVDLLEGVLRTVRQLEAGEGRVENAYARAVRPEGNARSRALLAEVFEVCDQAWRGVGVIPRSGFRLRPAYHAFDAARRFAVDARPVAESPDCISGQILKGLRKPHQCPAFGKTCTPLTPLGATMVSAEGACAAYHAYGRHLETAGVGP
jgi:hydrogenase expression/formation protein HypD